MNQTVRSCPKWQQLTIGLTGNPGSGKTTVAQLLLEKGAIVHSGDEIGYQMLESGSPVIHELTKEFGNQIFNDQGGISRKALGSIVFEDANRLRRLNEIVHPPMLQEIRSRVDAFRSNSENGPFVLDAALIFEWEIEDWFDRILVVSAPRELRRQRFEALRGDSSQFERREAVQQPESEKVKKAHWVIENDGELDALRSNIETIYQNVLSGKG